jgi:hypothetical protein
MFIVNSKIYHYFVNLLFLYIRMLFSYVLVVVDVEVIFRLGWCYIRYFVVCF